MKANDPYITLVRELEQKLYRKLTIKEQKFVKSMVEKQQHKLEKTKEVSNKIINMEQWIREKYNLHSND